jgi:hypothetical protein
MTELIPRSAWGGHNIGPEVLNFRGKPCRLHHTVTAYIDPEPVDESKVDYERPAHLGILWTGKFNPGWTTKAKVLRRNRNPHEANGGKFDGTTVPGVRRWSQMEVRRRGDGGYVIVQIDPERVAQIKAAKKAASRMRTAGALRVIALEKSAMRAMDAYHKRVFSSKGLGYCEVVFPSGRVYEGRGARWGAHTLGHNDDFGISMAGDYRNRQPTPRQREALLNRIRARGARPIIPHRRTFGTSCPGVSDSYIAQLNRDL